MIEVVEVDRMPRGRASGRFLRPKWLVRADRSVGGRGGGLALDRLLAQPACSEEKLGRVGGIVVAGRRCGAGHHPQSLRRIRRSKSIVLSRLPGIRLLVHPSR
jgi:hypothetical protein